MNNTQTKAELETKEEESLYTEILDLDDSATIAKDPNKKELMSFAQLYQELLKLNDIIIEIPSIEIDTLKDGLRDVKYRTNQKILKAGFDSDERRMDITVLETNEDTDVSKVRITYKEKKGISVMSLIKTEEEM